jgi:hypothetical protein
MTTHPDPAVDYPVDVVAYGDGHDVSKIRIVSPNAMVDLRYDIALLYSRKSLNLKSYPRPAKVHVPPNDKPTTITSQDVGLLSYNGLPTITKLHEHYPRSPRKELYDAVAGIWVDRLSYGKGKTAPKYHVDGVYHRISCYAGASGGWLINAAGQPIGISSLLAPNGQDCIRVGNIVMQTMTLTNSLSTKLVIILLLLLTRGMFHNSSLLKWLLASIRPSVHIGSDCREFQFWVLIFFSFYGFKGCSFHGEGALHSDVIWLFSLISWLPASVAVGYSFGGFRRYFGIGDICRSNCRLYSIWQLLEFIDVSAIRLGIWSNVS